MDSAAANRSGIIKYQDNGTNIGRIEYVHNGDKLQFQAGSATGQILELTNTTATFAGTVTATKLISTGGVLDLDDNGDADGVINARASLTLNIDSDANSTGEVFRINSNTTGVNTNNLFNITETGAATFAGKLLVNGASNTSNAAELDVKLAQTNGTLGAANTVHFGDQAHSDGQIMGITLGYKEHGNQAYRKLAIVAEGLADNAARQNFHILVDNVNDSGSANLNDRALSIDGITQETCLLYTSPSPRDRG